MKIEELKHNHSLTDLLKILLFAILMLAPALSVASRCLYVIANKNAYQSYSDDLIENQVQITNGNQYQIGAILQFNYEAQNGGSNTYSNQYTFSQINLDLQTIFGSSYNSNYNYDTISTRSDGYLYIADSSVNGSQINKVVWGTTITNFAIVYQGVSTTSLVVGNGAVLIYQYQYKTNKLDNVFEYSVSKLATDQMFTWTQNTPVFTGVQAMCTQLGITAPAIPIIIAYWLILTCVYIVIDIVIKLITYITHLIGARKGA